MRREKVSLGPYAESVHAHGEARPSSEELVIEDVVRAVENMPRLRASSTTAVADTIDSSPRQVRIR